MVPRPRLVRNWIDVSVGTPLDSWRITMIPYVLRGCVPGPIQQRGHRDPPACRLLVRISVDASGAAPGFRAASRSHPGGVARVARSVTRNPSPAARPVPDPRLLRCAPIRATKRAKPGGVARVARSVTRESIPAARPIRICALLRCAPIRATNSWSSFRHHII